MLGIPSVNRMVFSTVEEPLSTFRDQYVKGVFKCLIQWKDAICTFEDIQYGRWIPSALWLYSVLQGIPSVLWTKTTSSVRESGYHQGNSSFS